MVLVYIYMEFWKKTNHSGDFSCISDRLILYYIEIQDNYDMQEDM